MPELPEVETVRRGLEPVMVGAKFLKVQQRRPNLRFPFPARFEKRLTGTGILTLGRRAKYLVAGLSSGESLLMHLGMTGKFSIFGPDDTPVAPDRHDHVVFTLSGGYTVIYNDPRRFGFMDIIPEGELETSGHLAGIGLEPLGNALSGPVIETLFHNRKTPLKAALLDQRLIAGLGNIYVCEALFRSGLHPERMAGSISTGEAERLAINIVDVLNEAIAAGGSTLRDYAHTDGSLGYFQHAFKVYDREGESCLTPGCHGHIGRIVQSGRSTFLCPVCQKLPAK